VLSKVTCLNIVNDIAAHLQRALDDVIPANDGVQQAPPSFFRHVTTITLQG